MDENAAVEANDLGQSVVPKPSPPFRQRLSRLETFGADRDGLKAPFGVGSLGFPPQDVEHGRLGLLTGFDRREVVFPSEWVVEDENLVPGRCQGRESAVGIGDLDASREPGAMVVRHLPEEDLPHEVRGGEKTGVFSSLDLARGFWSGWRGIFVVAITIIEISDQTAERDTVVMKAFLQIFCFGRVVHIDAIVIRIQCFHETGVEFLPQQRNGLALGLQPRTVRDDLFPDMEINESGGREFGRA